MTQTSIQLGKNKITENFIETIKAHFKKHDNVKIDVLKSAEREKEKIKMYREDGYGTNQACMSVGNRHSIYLEHSQCLRLIDTRVSNGKLHFIVYFRSWDLWGGFPANLAAIQILKEYVASEIGVEDGELVASSKGLHLYDHCWELAESVVRR